MLVVELSGVSTTVLVFSYCAESHQHRRHGMQYALELVVIGFAQRLLPRSIKHPVQLFQVHIDTTSGGFLMLLPNQFAKPLRQWISQNLFDRAVRHVAVGLLAAPRRLSEEHPVGRAVTGSAESFRIHEGFQKVNRMPVHSLPVIRDPRRHTAQNNATPSAPPVPTAGSGIAGICKR